VACLPRSRGPGSPGYRIAVTDPDPCVAV